METWKDIPKHSGYQVSDLGRVRSIDRIVIDSRGFPKRLRGRTLTPGADIGGYMIVSLGERGGSKRVHRLALEAFIGPCPPGMEGAHNDSDPMNNELSNLRWDTPKGNHGDKVARGTIFRPRGEQCGLAKLTEEQARAILADLRPHREIAAIYGVKKWTVSAIKRGKRWAHLRVPPTMNDAAKAREWTFGGASLAQAVET